MKHIFKISQHLLKISRTRAQNNYIEAVSVFSENFPKFFQHFRKFVFLKCSRIPRAIVPRHFGRGGVRLGNRKPSSVGNLVSRYHTAGTQFAVGIFFLALHHWNTLEFWKIFFPIFSRVVSSANFCTWKLKYNYYAVYLWVSCSFHKNHLTSRIF